jgi:hypothetical protein
MQKEPSTATQVFCLIYISDTIGGCLSSFCFLLSFVFLCVCTCGMYESAGWSVFFVEWRLYSQDRCVSAKHSAHHAHCPHRQAHSTQLTYRISEPTRIKLVLMTLTLFEGQRHPSSLSMGFVEFALRIAAGLGVQPQRNMCHLHYLRHLFQLQLQPQTLRLFYLKGQFSVRSETVVAPPCVRAPVHGRCPFECYMSCRSVPVLYLPPLVMLTMMTMMLVHTRAAPVQSVHMHVVCLATLLSMIFVEGSKGGR